MRHSINTEGQTERAATSTTSTVRSLWSQLGLAGVHYRVNRLRWTAKRGRANAVLKENCASGVGFNLFFDTA
eukprot:13654461-Heterocapsa_arctica.AAC.1